MNDQPGSNDPLGPVYPHDPTKAQSIPRKSGLAAPSNIAGLIILAVVILVVIILLARDEPAAEAPAPAPAEISR